MAVESLGSSTTRPKVAPWNDPVIRGWVFQIVVVGLVGLLAWFLVSNTIDNLQRQKIASGFSYLNREAGFEIGDTMIAYSPASTYARAILVGMLNTLKVAVIGIVLSTILGTMIGVGRLSPNWLLAKICECFVEMFRNVPLLLVAVPDLQADQRGLPRPAPGDQRLQLVLPQQSRPLRRRCRSPTRPTNGWALAFLVGIVATIFVKRWAKKRQDATGQPFPTVKAGVGLIARPAAGRLAAGRRAPSHELAAAQGLQLRRRHRHPAGIHRAAGRPGALHLGLRRRDRALGHPGAAQGPERGGVGARPVARPGDAAGAAAAGDAR